ISTETGAPLTYLIMVEGFSIRLPVESNGKRYPAVTYTWGRATAAVTSPFSSSALSVDNIRGTATDAYPFSVFSKRPAPTLGLKLEMDEMLGSDITLYVSKPLVLTL